MRARHWILTSLVVFVCLWVAYAALAPFVFDGHLYKIESPVSVVEVRPDKVFLRVHRRALLSVPATCSRELVCDYVYHLPDDSCPIQRGDATFYVAFDIPNGAQGECVLQGLVSYSVAGAPLSHAWETEKFTIKQEEE
jgi:hypothetical protein